MAGIIWRELFPTYISGIIFLLYMSLFIGQGILVTTSQEPNNSYKYNPVTVVFLTECLKLIISTILYCRNHSFLSLINDVKKDSQILMLYFVPAFLYCLYNNLAFINLSTFDPTTYYLLLQLRVVITGILFQIIFKKYLSQRQWISLILLTIGCMIKQLNFNNDTNIQLTTEKTNSNSNNGDLIMNKNMNGFDFSISAVFILIQTICSCLAGVYNEYLLKDKGSNVNIFIQNIYMYLDSIICNAVILIIQGNIFNAFSYEKLQSIWCLNVILIIINNAAIGIVTSFFLKYMNSILKTFASALELIFTAILCYFLFAIPIYINTALAISVVSFSIYLYTQSPVVNLGNVKNTNLNPTPTPSSSSFDKLSTRNIEDMEKLLDDNHDNDDDLEMEEIV